MAVYMVKSKYLSDPLVRTENALKSGYIYTSYAEAKAVATILNCKGVEEEAHSADAMGTVPMAWFLEKQYSKWYVEKIEQAFFETDGYEVYDKRARDYIENVKKYEKGQWQG